MGKFLAVEYFRTLARVQNLKERNILTTNYYSNKNYTVLKFASLVDVRVSTTNAGWQFQ